MCVCVCVCVLPTVTLTWHACKYKIHKLYQRFILKKKKLLCSLYFLYRTYLGKCISTSGISPDLFYFVNLTSRCSLIPSIFFVKTLRCVLCQIVSEPTNCQRQIIVFLTPSQPRRLYLGETCKPVNPFGDTYRIRNVDAGWTPLKQKIGQAWNVFTSIVALFTQTTDQTFQSSGAVWKSRWPSWAPVPNKPKVSVDVKKHFKINQTFAQCLHVTVHLPTPPPPPPRPLNTFQPFLELCLDSKFDILVFRPPK